MRRQIRTSSEKRKGFVKPSLTGKLMIFMYNLVTLNLRKLVYYTIRIIKSRKLSNVMVLHQTVTTQKSKQYKRPHTLLNSLK